MGSKGVVIGAQQCHVVEQFLECSGMAAEPAYVLGERRGVTFESQGHEGPGNELTLLHINVVVALVSPMCRSAAVGIEHDREKALSLRCDARCVTGKRCGSEHRNEVVEQKTVCRFGCYCRVIWWVDRIRKPFLAVFVCLSALSDAFPSVISSGNVHGEEDECDGFADPAALSTSWHAGCRDA